MRQIILLFAALVLSSCAHDKNIDIFFDGSLPPHEFAAADIKATLEGGGYTVGFKALSDLSQEQAGQKVVILLKSNQSVLDLLVQENGALIELDSLGEQAFVLRTTMAKGKSFWIVGGENLDNDYSFPYLWDSKEYAVLEDMTPGGYEFLIDATDVVGNVAEKPLT